jgi:uncharacterized protein (DUF427 family)
MPRAVWNGAVLAEAADDAVLTVEGSVYFPPECVDRSYLRESRTRTVDPVKGVASHYDVLVDGEINADAAWFYAAPRAGAEDIAGCIAFRKGVVIEQDD